MKSTDERLIDLVERQAQRIADLEERVEAMTPEPEPEPEPVVKKWSEMTVDEKVAYTGSKYAS